jgi:pyruvyltransferase
MNITHFFYFEENGNFGDTVNKLFFEKLVNSKLNFLTRDNHNLFLHYFTTGSILSFVNENSIVYGSGFISETSNLGSPCLKYKINTINTVYKKPLQIISVRGPKTRAKLLSMGVDCPENYGDPLILFPLIYTKNIYPTIKYGIIPHYVDKTSNNLSKLFNNLGLDNSKIIDILIPDLNYKYFINQILDCEYIISSSLHGVIMGIIYKKKTIFVQFGKKVIGDQFKFFDFFESLEIKYQVKNIYTIELLENTINVDYNKLYRLVKNMINIAPFIDSSSKPILIKKYKNYLCLQ